MRLSNERHVLTAPFYIFIIIISFPLAQQFDVYGVSLRTYDLLLALFMLFLLPLVFIKNSGREASTSYKLFLFIILYGFITLIWSDVSNQYWLIIYQLILAYLTITIPYLMSKIIKYKNTEYTSVINTASIVLSFVFLFWMIYSGINQRFAIPSVTSAIISVIILPTIAVHLHNIINKKNRVISIISFFISVFSLFLTQSRVGLLIFVAYIIITVLRKPNLKKIIALIVLTTVFLIFFSNSIDTDRYSRVFEDAARTTMLETSINWGTSSVTSLVFGNGYGHIWNWALYQNGYTDFWDNSWLITEHGPIMYHAHSIFNQLFAELGLIGTIPFFAFVFILFRTTYNSFKEKNEYKTNILVALICTLPVFLTDLMIFRNWCASLIWLFYCFTTLQHKKQL